MNDPDIASTTAVILCGGLGTRLQSVIGAKPKALAEIAGRPFLDYQLTALRRHGVRYVVLGTGFGAESVQNYCRSGESWGIEIVYSREEKALGTAGAIKNAEALIQSDPFFAMNGDSMVRVDFRALLAEHVRTRANITLALVNVPDRSRYGSVRLADNSQIEGFEEKGAATGQGYINAGVYVINRDVLATVPSDLAVSIEHDVFPRYAGNGLFGFAASGPFIDIGTPESYQAAPDILAAIEGGSVS